MSEIERAIAHIERMQAHGMEAVDGGMFEQKMLDNIAESIVMMEIALTALREKAERERGCDVCAVTCYVCIHGADGGCGSYWALCSRANVKHEDNPHDRDLYNPKPYCDRCGRKLKEDVHD